MHLLVSFASAVIPWSDDLQAQESSLLCDPASSRIVTRYIRFSSYAPEVPTRRRFLKRRFPTPKRGCLSEMACQLDLDTGDTERPVSYA